MLTQTLRTTSRLIPSNVSVRAFTAATIPKFPQRKQNLNAEEQKEQKLFDDNKAKLDKMEHHTEDGADANRKSCEELKKIGDDARIEQNRPDDGVY